MVLFAAFLVSAGAAIASAWFWPGQWGPFALLKTLTTGW